MRNKLKVLAVWLLLLLAIPAHSQTEFSEEEIASYEKDVTDMVSFLEYMLNTVGSSATSARDKEVIITQSFRKIFRDDEVQIEDDLDENRDVITNKNVSAYFKDVDFFFEGVQFDLEINNISNKLNAGGNLFFKVELVRTLKGLNHEGDSVKNSKPRFVELNYNPEIKDLKIVSIYTNEFDRSKYLKEWWANLSFGWKSIFKEKFNIVSDEPGSEALKKMLEASSLDLSENQLLQDIDPLDEFRQLQSLDLSYTMISDITPLRNLNNLKTLRLNNTLVTHIDALKYATGIETLTLNATAVDDISVLSGYKNLKSLNISGSFIKTLAPLSSLTNIQSLDFSNTSINDLSPLSGMEKLELLYASSSKVSAIGSLSQCTNIRELYLDGTGIISIQPLRELQNLEILNISNTSANALQDLNSLDKLEKVYCDNTLVSKEQAEAYMKANPQTLVIYESKNLKTWWIELEDDWRNVIKKVVKVGDNPTDENLARVALIDSLNISGIKSIYSLANLTRMPLLTYLNIKGTSVKELREVSELKALKHLVFSNTAVADLEPLSDLKQLKIVEANFTGIESLNPLSNSENIEIVFADSSKVWDTEAIDFLRSHPKATVVYKSQDLAKWWESLPDLWKGIYRQNMPLPDALDKVALHKLSQLEEIQFERENVSSLSHLSGLIRLRNLNFSETAVSDITPLARHFYLEQLNISQNPIEDISPISDLKELRMLNISNTLVRKLEGIESHKNLVYFDCSGTQIKRLDGLETLQYLETLNCSNTRVKHLDPVYYSNLKLLKCFSTRVRSNDIEEFRSNNPDCNILYY
ncbi:leucine-rich repeat domain-containing protein [Fulvivirga sp.]|uniref:leucine-rich repeat domain-containing protein n=1 Tax=Fulvivirga sp. TaxID=1931237 RepID=UPI0032EAFD0F